MAQVVQRDFRFRAWDSAARLFEIDVQRASSSTRHRLSSFLDYLNSPDHIVLEFTGVQDKRMVDIYEGDIVVPEQRYRQEDGSFKWSPVRSRVRAVEWLGGSVHRGWNLGGFETANFEVVGNVFEHPDLIAQTLRQVRRRHAGRV